LDRHEVARPFAVAKGNDVQLQPDLLPGLGIVDQLGPHRLAGFEASADSVEFGSLGVGSLQDARGGAHDVVAAEARQTNEGVVDVDHLRPLRRIERLGLRDQQHVVDPGHGGFEQPQLLLVGPLLGDIPKVDRDAAACRMSRHVHPDRQGRIEGGETNRFAGFRSAAVGLFERPADRRRKLLPQRPAQQTGPIPLQDACSLVVEEGETPFKVEGEKWVADRFHRLGQPPPQLRPLPTRLDEFGDVLKGAAHPAYDAVFELRLADRSHPGHAAVSAPQLKGLVKGLASISAGAEGGPDSPPAPGLVERQRLFQSDLAQFRGPVDFGGLLAPLAHATTQIDPPAAKLGRSTGDALQVCDLAKGSVGRPLPLHELRSPLLDLHDAGDVSRHDEPGRPACDVHIAGLDLDVSQAAVPSQVRRDVAVTDCVAGSRARWRLFDIGRRPDVGKRHSQKFFAGVAVVGHGGVVHLKGRPACRCREPTSGPGGAGRRSDGNLTHPKRTSPGIIVRIPLRLTIWYFPEGAAHEGR
jgi:hypothetical protein